MRASRINFTFYSILFLKSVKLAIFSHPSPFARGTKQQQSNTQHIIVNMSMYWLSLFSIIIISIPCINHNLRWYKKPHFYNRVYNNFALIIARFYNCSRTPRSRSFSNSYQTLLLEPYFFHHALSEYAIAHLTHRWTGGSVPHRTPQPSKSPIDRCWCSWLNFYCIRTSSFIYSFLNPMFSPHH